MPSETILNQFPPKTRDDWRTLVDKALKDAAFDSLVTQTHDGLDIQPLYSRSLEAAGADVSIAGHMPASRRTADLAKGGAWDIRALHTQSDPLVANADIIDDLTGGVNSICLQMEAPGQNGLTPTFDAMATALSGTHLDMIHLSVLAGDQYIGAALAMMALWDQNDIKPGQRRGAIHADPLGHLARTGGLENKLYDTLRTLAHFISTNHADWPDVTLMLADARPYHDAGASEVQELAAMLATFVSYLRLGDEDGIAPYKVLPRIAVALAADADLFLTIAKVRAARLLIARVADICGAEMFAPSVSIWTQTSERMMSTMDPHTNMLRTTVAATGAILGGTDALTVLPFDWPAGEADPAATKLSRRMARNTQIILAGETDLARVIDPAAGSWYVDRLTDALARKAWELFQELEAGHGIEEALRQGRIQDQIAKTADKRRKAIADGDAPMVGTSVFPPKEGDVEIAQRYTADAPDVSTGETVAPLERLRLADPYEAAHQPTPA